MAKLAFSKLGLDKSKIQEIKNIEYNGQHLEIKQYLSIHEKMNMINEIMEYTISSSVVSFKNPLGVEMFSNLKIVEYYTNINFTDKQKEDLEKLYDLMESNNLFSLIIDNIPVEEYDLIISVIEESLEAFYSYKNSAIGLLETLKTDYSNAEIDLRKIQDQIKDPNSLEFVKDLLSKLN